MASSNDISTGRGSKRQKLAPSGTKDDPFTIIPKNGKWVSEAYYMKNGILRYWNGQLRFPCDVVGCIGQFKRAGHLKEHKACVHDIDVVWHACDVVGCIRQSKQAGFLKRHKAGVHDIGALECEICYNMCGKTLRHEFTYGNTATTGVVDVCRQCCLDYGFKKDRIEHRYMEKLNGYIDFPAYDDQTVHGNACFRYRPDRLYLDAHMRVHIHLECDEGQHMWSSGSYDCEEKRISDIYDEFANIVPRHYVVVRFNPDEYDKNDADRDEVFEERVKHVAEIVQFVRGNPPPERISIVYMYYSRGNPQIAKNLPVYFVDDEYRDLNYDAATNGQKK